MYTMFIEQTISFCYDLPTMVKILDGRALASAIHDKIKTRVAVLPSQPGLTVLLVGDDPASHLYVSLKRQACEQAGIAFELLLYPANAPEEKLIEKITGLNTRDDIHGILVQLPLPSQNADRVIAAIDPLKDVDGFHPKNLEKLKLGKPCIASAVALGVMKLIDEAGARGHAVIVSSPLFAAPLQVLLKERGVDSTVVQAEDPKLTVHTRKADILIVAEGIPELITADMVKPGSTVIDVGTTRTDEGLKGDVDFESVKKVAGAITPVPGGVGPMTVAMLLVNILKAYDLQRKRS
ncbi:MAG: Bifunctional protein FolD [Candidatus Uhrbacteria bacterium GW2011_GWA2_52_8d]|uniref:Bifunctional protein FolD n=1 Tax=Candidatus Uhrbacteria bacterium GW2011_GWA2_52_8d TaxID=1618979 RepID=A0A0G1XR40_9BACT|nr:MAG: Bifunctional protein FolD [Candidatus Uhrbacteria bacterium GW2011_GWA2_52_8d]